MPAVSNTSPLLNLAIIDHLHLLQSQYPEILVPPAVRSELQADRPRLGSARLRAVLDEGWVRVTELTNPLAAVTLGEHVDQGEAEAIALALELHPTWLLMDEREGRMLAARLGLRVTGVLGILLRAHAAGEIHALAPLLEALRTEADFYLAEALRNAALVATGEA